MIPLKQFMLAGNATFTVSNTQTQNRLTFRVKQKWSDKENPIRFVSVLTGADNESSYTFLGTIFPDGNYRRSNNSRITADAQSAKTFAWLWKHVEKLSEFPQIEIRHAGKCCKCGKQLTVPESIDSGIGPECRKHFSL